MEVKPVTNLCPQAEFLQFSLCLWLSGMDSNHDKSLQRALCYRYTTGQTLNRT